MYEVFNVGDTILLDGEALSLVTRVGVKWWDEAGETYTYRFDQVRDPLDGEMKYRCLFEKDEGDVPFVLVNDPKKGDGRVVLFDQKPDALPMDL